MSQPERLQIVDADADQRFREMVTELGWDIDDRWVGGYVDYEWSHGRHVFEQYAPDGKRVLEFGSNFGGTSTVLAALGAHVSAVDVDAKYVALTRLNTARYGMRDRVEVHHVPDTRTLPFETASFDAVSAISVLEYVDPQHLAQVQREIDRVLRPGGLIFISGTSNRLWPREVHSGKWLVNYLPRFVDHWVGGRPIARGLWPWQLRFGFGRYVNLDAEDRGLRYLTAKRRIAGTASPPRALEALTRLLRMAGTSAGLFTPNIAVVLRKRSPPTS